jgi:hypothetical protein
MLLALALCPFIFHLTPTWLFPPSLFRHHPSCLHPWFSCCQNQWYITFNFFILLTFLSNGWFSFVMWGTFFKILWQRCSWIILFLFSFFQDYFFLYLFVLVTTMKYLRHTNLERKEACWTLFWSLKVWTACCSFCQMPLLATSYHGRSAYVYVCICLFSFSL